MKVKKILKQVELARRYALMESAEFGSVSAGQVTPEPPVRMLNGDLVTESNVTAFIRERVRIYHAAWIIGNLDGAIQELQS